MGVLVNRKVKSSVVLCLLMVASSTVSAQTAYSFDNVIETTLGQNPILQSRELEIKSYQNLELKSKMQFLPNLNGYASHGYNWGQSIDPFTNQFASSRVRTNRFALSADLDIFNGLERYFSLQGSSLSIQQAELQLLLEKKRIIKEVAVAYLQLLLILEEQRIDSLGLDLLNDQMDLVTKKANGGQVSYNDTISIHIEKLSTQTRLIQGFQNERIQENILKEWMGLKPDDEITFSDDLLELNVSLEKDQLEIAEVSALKLRIEEERVIGKQLKSVMYPQFYFNYTTGTGYSGNSIQLNPDGSISPTPFFKQLDQNFYQSLTFNLTVPIFNKMDVVQDRKNQELRIQQAELALKDLQISVEYEYFELKQKYLDKVSNLELAQEIEILSKKNFDWETEKFRAGLINFYQLSLAQNSFLKRKSERNKATFESYLARLMIAVYLEEVGL